VKRLILVACVIAIAQFGFSENLSTNFQESAPKFFAEAGVVKGVCVDIISALNAQLSTEGITIKADDPSNPFIPFSRIKSRLETGEIDIFVGMARTAARMEIYNFIDTPAYEVKSTFAKKKSFDFVYNSPADLAGQKVAVVAGSKTAGQMEAVDGINLQPVSTLEQAVRMLASGRVDLVFYHSLGLGHTISSLGLGSSLTYTEKAYEEYAHYIAFSKSIPSDTVSSIGTALDELHANGKIGAIMGTYLAQ
jgi:polar amino acid transport system substrate-binding protein